MKIVVLLKQVPDTWGDRRLAANGLLDRAASENVLDEIDEKAVEVALQAQSALGGEVVVVSMGPAAAIEGLRKALAMGADSAIHVLDDALVGADTLATSAVLAEVLTKLGYDLVIAGNESTDGRGGVVPVMVAERLGLAAATQLRDVRVSATDVTGERVTEDATALISAPLPALISITESAAEARFPSFMGIMKAKKKPLATWTLQDLALTLPAPRTLVASVSARPARAAGIKVTDDGDAAAALAEYLVSRRLL